MTSDEEQSLFQAAAALAKVQAAQDSDGVGVAAAALTEDGTTLTGLWIDAMCNSACLCAETGPICDAHGTGRKLTASICVRWMESSGATVQAACGICQERLAFFGTGILIGVADNSERGFQFSPLAILRSSPWWDVLETEPTDSA
ncbi:MAG: hypothetical protein WKF60_03100 [Ilumatobacter sp.]